MSVAIVALTAARFRAAAPRHRAPRRSLRRDASARRQSPQSEPRRAPMRSRSRWRWPRARAARGVGLAARATRTTGLRPRRVRRGQLAEAARRGRARRVARPSGRRARLRDHDPRVRGRRTPRALEKGRRSALRRIWVRTVASGKVGGGQRGTLAREERRWNRSSPQASHSSCARWPSLFRQTTLQIHGTAPQVGTLDR
jgi:hypothetical protein